MSPTSDPNSPQPPPEVVTGRDVELIAVGVVCFSVAGWTGLTGPRFDWVPVGIFVLLGGLSLGLAWWDLRTRGDGAGSQSDAD